MAVLQIRGGLHRAHEIFPPNLLGAASTPNGRNGSCDELPSTTGPFLGALDRPRHEVRQIWQCRPPGRLIITRQG